MLYYYSYAGILVGMPDSYYRQELATGAVAGDASVTLGPLGSFGSGIIFTPRSEAGVKAIQSIFEAQVKQCGLKILAWRSVVTDNSLLGDSAKATEPRMEQVFIENVKKLPYQEFDRLLFKVRKLVEAEASVHPDIANNMYICSLSSQTITYKGQLTPEQVLPYFHDLQQENFMSHMALVHSRFSTNTFPSWERAQVSDVSE